VWPRAAAASTSREVEYSRGLRESRAMRTARCYHRGPACTMGL
jgi:hypothetical protein